MKITSKNTFGLILILCGVYIFYGCNKDYQIPNELCGPLTGKTVDKELGRVYSRILFGTQIYYIGNPDTTLRNGGNAPCNGIPDDFIPNGEIGVLVIYSGELNSNVQSSSKDPYDPLYGGIELSFIEKEKEG
jgi:hypothetical protein